MQLVWNHILPAIKEEGEETTGETPTEKLREISARLTLPIETASAESDAQDQANGKTYVFEENDFKAETVSFSFSPEECELTFVENGRTIRVKSGLQRWITADNKKEGNTLFANPGRTPMPTKISSHYRWTSPDTLLVKLKYVENIHHDLFTFTFSDAGLVLSFATSLSFNPDERPDLKAQISSS